MALVQADLAQAIFDRRQVRPAYQPIVAALAMGQVVAGDLGPHLERRYLSSVAHDHDTVLSAARILLRRVEVLTAGAPARADR
jgi:DNA-binding transcriptional regulator YdaS (Cro superfamily)